MASFIVEGGHQLHGEITPQELRTNSTSNLCNFANQRRGSYK